MSTCSSKNLLRLILCFSFLFALYACGGDVSESVSSSDSSNDVGGASGGSATLTWVAPTINSDGTPLTDLAGYKVYYGTASGSYGTSIDKQSGSAGLTCQLLTNPDRTECTYAVTDLNSGTKYWFAVTSYNTSSNESAYSDEVNKTIP